MIRLRKPPRPERPAITIRRPHHDHPREWLDYRYLNDWLRVATAGLSDDSRARIRDEIGDHFYDAIEEGLGAGLPTEAAAERAVESLGNPRTARRAFRRTYLTHWQAYFVRRFIDTPSPRPNSALLRSLSPQTPLWDPNRERLLRPLMCLILVSLTATVVATDHRRGLLHLALLAFMLVAALVNVTVVPSLARRGRERATIAVGATTEVALWSAFILAPALSGRMLVARLWIVSGFALFTAAAYAPIFRKLSARPS